MFSPVLQVWSPSGSQASDQGAHRPEVSDVGTQAADQGAHPPGVSGAGAHATDWGMHPPGCFGPVGPGSWAGDLDAH